MEQKNRDMIKKIWWLINHPDRIITMMLALGINYILIGLTMADPNVITITMLSIASILDAYLILLSIQLIKEEYVED